MGSLLLTRLRQLEKGAKRRNPRVVLHCLRDCPSNTILGVNAPPNLPVLRLTDPLESIADLMARGAALLGTWVLMAVYAPEAAPDDPSESFESELALSRRFAFDDAVAASGDLLPSGWGI